jgi:hypothetical protein
MPLRDYSASGADIGRLGRSDRYGPCLGIELSLGRPSPYSRPNLQGVRVRGSLAQATTGAHPEHRRGARGSTLRDVDVLVLAGQQAWNPAKAVR